MLLITYRTFFFWAPHVAECFRILPSVWLCLEPEFFVQNPMLPYSPWRSCVVLGQTDFQIFSTVLMQILYLTSWIMLEVWFFQHQLSCTPFHPEWQLLQICSCRCSFVCFLSICFKSSWTNMIKRLVIICRIHIIFSKSPSRPFLKSCISSKKFKPFFPLLLFILS